MSESEYAPVWLIETSDAQFEADVMVRSQIGLVIVDFWADWCGPCRALAPVLEQVVSRYDGRVTLVKANTDRNADAAARFGVRGIPALFAVFDGQVIDSVQGALPEQALAEWIDRCASIAELANLEREIDVDPTSAEAKLRQRLADNPMDAEARVLLLKTLHRAGKLDACRRLLEELEQRGFLEPEVERIRSEIDLRDKSGLDVAALERAVQTDPADRSAMLQLGQALAGHGQYARAMDLCLQLIEEDREGTGEEARRLMLEIFNVLGDEAELTLEYRRKLAMALY